MIGVGVIGYGYWGPNLVRNFAEAAGARLVAVCDERAERLAAVRARYPGVTVTPEATTLIADPQVDAIAVATPVASHFDLAHRALAMGKHVLVEKPLAASVEQAERLVEAAATRHLVLMVDHTFVYSGAVRRITDLVRSGDLGDIYYYDAVRVNLGLFQHDVNVIWDLAVHDLSILDQVVGARPAAVSATGMSHVLGEPANIAYLTLFFDRNLIAHIHANWLAPVKVRRTLIGGSRKMIVWDELEPSDPVKVYDSGITLRHCREGVDQLLVGYRTGDMWAPRIDRTEALAVEARHFLECIAQARCPLTDGEAGLRLVRVLEAADLSIVHGGRPVTLAGASPRRALALTRADERDSTP